MSATHKTGQSLDSLARPSYSRVAKFGGWLPVPNIMIMKSHATLPQIQSTVLDKYKYVLDIGIDK